MIRERYIDNFEDVLDVRDIIERVKDLESDLPDTDEDTGERAELEQLSALLNELRGNGGDEQWEGAWYPVTLIRDSFFVRYAEELAEDIGAVSSDGGWPTYCIDWEWAARELKMDYSTVEFGGVTYWYR